MDAFVIRGGKPLSGTIRINGAKNAALPLMAAALLTDKPITLRDIPNLADIRNMQSLLAELGCDCVRRESPAEGLRIDGQERGRSAPLALQSTVETASHARYEIVRTMRASVCVLGPLLARRGEARIAMPGGCAIGDRPIDLHLKGLASLGAEVRLDSGDMVLTAPRDASGRRRLRGARIFLGGRFGSTVLGTANIMSAATLAEGVTVIESAACEPEIVDLARLLTQMGARIEGAGTPRITIEGVESLSGADHTVIPDRIEAGTFMIGAAITDGDVTITNCPLDAMMAVTETLKEVGVGFDIADDDDPLRSTVRVTRNDMLRPTQITTQPHPGFPTDLQAQLMALVCLADGNSVITERIFPQRFLHVAELSRLGARLTREDATAVVTGVDHLVGAPVMASDLRASASLVLAGLSARGATSIRRVYHLDRGYERMELGLRTLGADIERVRDDKPVTVAAPQVGDYEAAPVSAGGV
jgi:UDP-N-acetylglucosamine 1-carboxyvinyltransferase